MDTDKKKRTAEIPPWLVSRQLNTRMSKHGVLPPGVRSEDLIEFLDEENTYGGMYSQDLLAMLSSVDQALIWFLNRDPVFYREIFEPWYFDSLAPHIFNRKLPPHPPHIQMPTSNGNLFLAGAIGVIVLMIAYLLSCALNFNFGDSIRHVFAR